MRFLVRALLRGAALLAVWPLVFFYVLLVTREKLTGPNFAKENLLDPVRRLSCFASKGLRQGPLFVFVALDDRPVLSST